jgi:hypothetical protein
MDRETAYDTTMDVPTSDLGSVKALRCGNDRGKVKPKEEETVERGLLVWWTVPGARLSALSAQYPGRPGQRGGKMSSRPGKLSFFVPSPLRQKHAGARASPGARGISTQQVGQQWHELPDLRVAIVVAVWAHSGSRVRRCPVCSWCDARRCQQVGGIFEGLRTTSLRRVCTIEYREIKTAEACGRRNSSNRSSAEMRHREKRAKRRSTLW